LQAEIFTPENGNYASLMKTEMEQSKNSYVISGDKESCVVLQQTLVILIYRPQVSI